MNSATASNRASSSRGGRRAGSGVPSGGTAYSCSPRSLQELAAGGHDGEPGRRFQQATDHRCATQQLLEVVEDDEQAEVAQVGFQCLDDRSVRILRETEGTGDGGGDETGIGDRREVDEERTGREVQPELLGDGHAQTSLAAAARAGEA